MTVETSSNRATAKPLPEIAALEHQLEPPLTRQPSERHVFRSPELDGLRGVAVALVVLFHAPDNYLKYAVHSSLAAHVLSAWTLIRNTGWIGVDIFFALSGFLITRNLLETRTQPHYFRNFYVRRALRIVPLYLFILALVGALYPHSGTYIALCFVYLANFASLFGQQAIYPVLWSLSVEEHFYLVWPSLVKPLSRKTCVTIGVIVCLASPIARAVAIHYKVFDPLYSFFRFDGFMYGALVAFLFTSPLGSREKLARWARSVSLAAVLVLLGAAPFHVYTRYSAAGGTLLYSLIAALSSALIAYSLAKPGASATAPLRNPGLRLLGDISYWVYLIHWAFLRPVDNLLDRLKSDPASAFYHAAVPLYAAELAYLALACVLTGILVRKYVEIPILRLKRYF